MGVSARVLRPAIDQKVDREHLEGRSAFWVYCMRWGRIAKALVTTSKTA